jgi:hypothetical protein
VGHAQSVGNPGDLVYRAEDLLAHERCALLTRIVVQQADHAPGRVRRELFQQNGGSLARAEDEDRRRPRFRHQGAEMSFLPGAVGEPAARHHGNEKQGRQDIDGPRHYEADPPEGKHGGHRQPADGSRKQDATQIRQARETPQPSIKAQREVREGVDQ